MATYRVYVKVEYIVKADSSDYALQLVRDGAEFPLLPFTETNYCDRSEVVLAHLITDKREA